MKQINKLIVILLALSLTVICYAKPITIPKNQLNFTLTSKKAILSQSSNPMEDRSSMIPKKIVSLPKPDLTGSMSLEKAISNRRSIRNYSDEPLSLNHLSQLLWAAQGISSALRHYRTAPSAGAIYPFELFIAVKNVRSLPAGIYKYSTKEHQIEMLSVGNITKELSAAALGQNMIEDAALTFVFAARFPKITARYGERGIRYANIEAGHISQNVYLQAETLNLGTVAIGAFDYEVVSKVLNLPKNLSPLYIMPVGAK